MRTQGTNGGISEEESGDFSDGTRSLIRYSDSPIPK